MDSNVLLDAKMLFVALPETGAQSAQAFEITTPLLRTPQPGQTIDGLLGVAGLGDGANDVGNGAPTRLHLHADKQGGKLHVCSSIFLPLVSCKHACAGETLVMSNGTEVGPALWVTRNQAFFAVPSVAAAGFAPSDLEPGLFPGYKFSTAGYNESFTSFGS